ncbi:glycosyltransferase family 2 protein [Veillonella sp. R32]|uniref:glycosyltransferase family 2 protein n=1 Tax=Veillonella sp. R32 TaxID=2021312 RepID=UPI00138A466E|nr:glycosyltransferase family 2 protein [Veillonella sp. R32]KAF1683955.1 glycosyltransferase [Veillonella sp. R32]
MLLSVVVPVYNEEANIKKFYSSVKAVLNTLPYEQEIIFVDDGSADNSALMLKHIAEEDKAVKVLLLARNFGHQLALTCGLDYAKGDAVITMDGDMQHPPELIPQLVHLWEEGHDVVRTIRDSTEDASWAKAFTSKYYYKLMNKMANVPIVEGGSDFRLMNRKALNTLLRFREHGRFLRGIVGDIGYNQAEIHFVAPPRFAGKSKFSVRKMLHFALDGIAAFSKVPLRAAFYVGLLSGLLSLIMILHILFVHFFTDSAVSGWATLGVAIFFLGGVQLIGLGIIGEYVGRVFEEVKHRPLYWVRDSFNCEASHKQNPQSESYNQMPK